MSLQRDQRIFASLVRKAQDPGIPLPERQAFRAKAEEIYRRLAASRASGDAAKAASARTDTPADTKPAAPTMTPRSAPKTPDPAAAAQSSGPKVRRWRPLSIALAGGVGIGIGFVIQNNPGPAMVVFGCVIATAAAGAAWMRRAAGGNDGIGSTAG